jgi:hypothetical protein|nr:MAG TPA_asm: hypothetical protein [Caudoviricetes sp.]
MGVVCELDYNETDFDLDVLLDNPSIIEDGSQMPAEDSDISAYSDVANLDYDQYLRITFNVYNERYEGSYPNLRYKANVCFRITGKFAIQASNIVKFGGLTWSGYMNYGYWTTDTGWINIPGEINEDMGCNRQRSFSWNCSISGWPNLSGTANVTTPLISAPEFEASVSDIDVESLTINGKLISNPYNLYCLRVFSQDKRVFISNNLNGSVTVNGLIQKTQYEYHVQVWKADLSGAYVNKKILTVTTLENYPEISIESVDFVITEVDSEYDNVTLTVHTTDDSHVKSSTWGEGGAYKGAEGTSITYNNLPKNLELDFEVTIEDTLGRSSKPFNFKFNTTFTYMEAWVFVDGEWKRGYSMAIGRMNRPKLDDEISLYSSGVGSRDTYSLVRLSAYDGLEWHQAIPYKEES